MLILKDKRVYFALLTFFIVVYVLRMYTPWLPDFVASHSSNFSLGGIIFLAAGYVLLMKRGFTRKSLLLWMLPLALANVIVELFVGGGSLGNFNTADPVDIIFGLAALVVIAVTVLLFAVRKPVG